MIDTRTDLPRQYAAYRKPRWAPPVWLFGPVWTILYLLIAASYGYVLYLWLEHGVSNAVFAPFALNIVLNLAYTWIQFRLRNLVLATIDVLLVLGTLVWACISIYPYAAWVAYANIPYVLWICFATVLQIAVAMLNWKR